VYVFGTNCDGELGLGDATRKAEFPRPVLNPKLAADTVGVVYLTVGGVHSAALTHDNKILTWGVNDEGALGRDTKQDPGEIKMHSQSDSDSDSEDDDPGNLNLKEATPLPVDPSCFPDDTIFTQLAATDSATFALTAEGLVYGWGNFRVSPHYVFHSKGIHLLTWESRISTGEWGSLQARRRSKGHRFWFLV
jgi:regulator of chromosome condensation